MLSPLLVFENHGPIFYIHAAVGAVKAAARCTSQGLTAGAVYSFQTRCSESQHRFMTKALLGQRALHAWREHVCAAKPLHLAPDDLRKFRVLAIQRRQHLGRLRPRRGETVRRPGPLHPARSNGCARCSGPLPASRRSGCRSLMPASGRRRRQSHGRARRAVAVEIRARA